MECKTFVYGEGKFALEAQVCCTANGLNVTLCTVEHGHVGAVAVAVPDEGQAKLVDCVLLPTHRDDISAKDMALKLAAVFEVPVVVSAGLHIDNASKSEIVQLVSNAKELAEIMIEDLGGF